MVFCAFCVRLKCPQREKNKDLCVSTNEKCILKNIDFADLFSQFTSKSDGNKILVLIEFSY